MNNDTLKKDTVIYYDGKMYLFSNSLYANALRIATRISGISTVFVFKKMKSFYKLSLIETYLTDTSFKVQYVFKSILEPTKFTSLAFDSLRLYDKYVDFYSQFSVFQYHFDSEFVYYNRVDHFPNRVQDAQSYEKAVIRCPISYLAMERIEYKESLLYFVKDQNWPLLYDWKYR